MIFVVCVVAFLVLNVLGVLLWKFYSERNNCVKNYDNLNERYNKVYGQLASIRVKHGQTWETFLPLMSTFEETLGPKENAQFLGQPIDLIYFNKNEIIFVEVKTGNSKLSSRQRQIRNLVKDRKIRWAEVNDDTYGSASRATDPISSVVTTTITPPSKQ